MSKYIDVDKLVAKINREKKNLSNQDFGERCAIIAYNVVLSFITSLQQEQPEVDLEKEVKIDADLAINLWSEVENFCLEYDARKDAWYNMVPQDQKLVTNPTWLNFALNIASHFYELGLKARKENTK